ncbi:MAG: hypothetical protein DWQ19_08995 [Crenarchaeota archaeon]|nr:MAG: hypothetical protein DWQ19_08995 [Thermoproteota archaeon]
MKWFSKKIDEMEESLALTKETNELKKRIAQHEQQRLEQEVIMTAQDKPKPRQLTDEDMCFNFLNSPLYEKYKEICYSITYNPFPLYLEKLKLFLKEKNIGVYDQYEIMQYQNKVFHRENFGWFPLKKGDETCKTSKYWSEKPEEYKWCGTQWEILNSLYSQPIPLNILQTVKFILNEFPSANFLISNTFNDVYLAVGFTRTNVLIVDCWDNHFTSDLFSPQIMYAD